MLKNKADLEYYLLDETKCGPEPLFVLIGGAQEHFGCHVDEVFQALVRLVAAQYLECLEAGKKLKAAISLEELQEYARTRLAAGEDLQQPPDVGEEYCFAATSLGRQQLRPEDRPVPRQES